MFNYEKYNDDNFTRILLITRWFKPADLSDIVLSYINTDE